MPPAFQQLAEMAAERAGFAGFKPDSCLINRYEPGAKLSLHQDRNEKSFLVRCSNQTLKQRTDEQ
jgi:DNA oxidative demethylase